MVAGIIEDLDMARRREGAIRWHPLKSALDRLTGMVCLIILAPLLCIIAGTIWVSDRGNPIFTQRRVGYQSQPLIVYKFRTMVVDAERKGAGLYFEKDDPRITGIGRVLRKTSADELPQLWNLVRGTMSLVGPRPPHPTVYQQNIEEYNRIFSLVRPGITGLAQVSGRNALTRSERLALDLTYAENCSAGLDARIVCRTIPAVLLGKGVMMSQEETDVE